MQEEKVRRMMLHIHGAHLDPPTYVTSASMKVWRSHLVECFVFTPAELAAHDKKIAREAWDAAVESCENIGEWPEFEDWWKKRGKV